MSTVLKSGDFPSPRPMFQPGALGALFKLCPTSRTADRRQRGHALGNSFVPALADLLVRYVQKQIVLTCVPDLSVNTLHPHPQRCGLYDRNFR